MTPVPVAEIVRNAWGDTPPDWIRALRDEIIFSSQNQVAKRIGVNASAVNGVLRGTYNNGNMAGPEARVRAVLMREVVPCPKLGEIALAACQSWQAKALIYSPNPLRVRMNRACNSCPHNRTKGAKDGQFQPTETH